MDRKTVTKKEIAAAIATKTAMPITQVGEVVQLWMDRVIEELAGGNRIELRDFGVFEVRQRSARTGRNPKTGEKVEVPARAAVVFKAGKVMKGKVESTATLAK
jgi:integration host factor subunit beta